MTEKIEVLPAVNGNRGWDVVVGGIAYPYMTQAVAQSCADKGAEWLSKNAVGFPTEAVRRGDV